MIIIIHRCNLQIAFLFMLARDANQDGSLLYAEINLSCFQKDFIGYCAFDSAIAYLLYQVNVEVLYFLGALDFFGALYLGC